MTSFEAYELETTVNYSDEQFNEEWQFRAKSHELIGAFGLVFIARQHTYAVARYYYRKLDRLSRSGIVSHLIFICLEIVHVHVYVETV